MRHPSAAVAWPPPARLTRAMMDGASEERRQYIPDRLRTDTLSMKIICIGTYSIPDVIFLDKFNFDAYIQHSGRDGSKMAACFSSASFSVIYLVNCEFC